MGVIAILKLVKELLAEFLSVQIDALIGRRASLPPSSYKLNEK